MSKNTKSYFTKKMDNSEIKQVLKTMLLSSAKSTEVGSGFYVFEQDTKKQLFPLIERLIKNEDSDFTFDLKNIFQNIDFKLFDKRNITKEYRYIKQGGGDLYSYIKINIQAIDEPILIIKEELPIYLQELIDGSCPKIKCVEWALVYPYILRAVIDFCIENKVIGLIVNLLEVKFHPVDFRDYAYYACARKLLNNIFNVVNG